jgi:hypothetical protein
MCRKALPPPVLLANPPPRVVRIPADARMRVPVGVLAKAPARDRATKARALMVHVARVLVVAHRVVRVDARQGGPADAQGAVVLHVD